MRNAVRCIICDEAIESTSRHDFKWCSGRHVAVDGGKEYKRRVFTDPSVFEEIEDEDEENKE